MSVESVVHAGRAAAERLMLDTLAFGSNQMAPNPDTDMEEETFVATFTTPGKVAGTSADSDQTVRMVTVGGTERPVISGGIHIPADRPETVPTGMLVKVIELGPASPAHMLNRVYRVEGESTKSYQTARRFDVVEV